ncbi:tetratricopeptide repeat protein, partial [Acinetobacter baumannii]|nr:sel1 repeat family protein [Acinetobacter baumannii]EKV6054197.1 sel1 repeat family protein [Acinetobacter baumannii]EKW5332290.1 sel1 repeat family protein [Acinetobacter baumannii]HEC0076065.1 sel1 repeat family protein [Acinetobacter baumannii]
VNQDYKKAFEWYSKAAQQENDEAQFTVGMMYYKGEGVQQNNELAEKWLRKAAENGNKDALSLFEE